MLARESRDTYWLMGSLHTCERGQWREGIENARAAEAHLMKRSRIKTRKKYWHREDA